MTSLNDSVQIWIDKLNKYSSDYADCLTWGGPTIYPKNPVDLNGARELVKILIFLKDKNDGI